MELDKFESNAEIQDLFFNFNGIGKEDFKEEKKSKKKKKKQKKLEEEKNEPYIIKGQVYKKKKVKKIYTDEEQLQEYKNKHKKVKKKKKKMKEEEEEELEIEDEIKEIEDKDLEKIDIHSHKLGFTKEEKKEMKFKKPYSAHGWKYTNNKIKLHKLKESDNNEENFVKPYKEKIFMREKDINLFPIENKGNNIIDNKKKRLKTSQIKRTFHYLEPIKKKVEKKNKYSDYEESEENEESDILIFGEENDIDIDKVDSTKKKIKDNYESFQKTNETLSEMKNIMSKKEYDKLINDMGKNNNNNNKDNKSKNEFFKEEKSLKGDNIDISNKDNFENEKIKFEELQNRIKDEIKKKGNFDFNKLTKEEHDLITKMKLYRQIEEKKLEKEREEKEKKEKERKIKEEKVKKTIKNKKRPNTSSQINNKYDLNESKRNILNNDKNNIYKIVNKNKNDLISNPNNKFNFFTQKFTKQPIIKKQFIGCDSQNINNQLNYIPKVGMNGFLVHSYNKKKEYTNKYNFKSVFVNETEDFIPPVPFKAKPAPKFNKILNKNKENKKENNEEKKEEIQKELNKILDEEAEMNHPFLAEV